MTEEFRVLRPREFHSGLVGKGKRADGRGLEEFRDIELETEAIRTADSSSLVKLGNTSLVCGCTVTVVPNNAKESNEENEPVKVRVVLPPICSNSIDRRSLHSEHSLTRMMRHILDDSNCFEKENLKITDSDHTWIVDAEAICLNNDGCILDAALVATLSALKSLVLANSNFGVSAQFPLKSLPICSTFALINDIVICDPSLEEEGVAQSTFSITVDAITERLCNVNKLGGTSLKPDQLNKCLHLAKNQARKLKQLLELSNVQRMDTG